MSGKRWLRAVISPDGRTVEALFEVADFDARIFRRNAGAMPVDPEEVDEEFAGQRSVYLTEQVESVLKDSKSDRAEPLSIDDLRPYVVSTAEELQECADNWAFCRLIQIARNSDYADADFDSRDAARLCLQLLDEARDMRLLASGSKYLSAERRYRLYIDALRLERNLPIHGLLSLGIVSEYAHPADNEWLLREHLAGRWNGVQGTGEIDFDSREMPWIRDCDMGLMVSELELPPRNDLDAWERFIQDRVQDLAEN